MQQLEKAVEYAFTLVTGSGPTQALRSFDVRVNVSERGGEVAAIHEGLDRSRPEMAALVSLMAGDAVGFREQLEERVKVYKKQHQKSPNIPEGTVYVFGLALCRLALERGIEVEDGPYLPTRLLSHGGPAVSVHERRACRFATTAPRQRAGNALHVDGGEKVVG